jgi:hypothetical protein
MRDLLEQALASRLRAVGETVLDDLEPPAELEREIMFRRRRARTVTRRARALALAAAIVAVVATVAVVGSQSSSPRVGIAAVLVRDPLPAGTVMFATRGRDVIALDSNGRRLATMVHADRGNVIDAQVTRDHRSLWYLSVAGTPGIDCGEVVRADVAGGESKIMAHAIAFAISPDARRLALSGYGDVALGHCDKSASRAVAVVDLWTRATAQARAIEDQLGWSRDGRSLVSRVCGLGECRAVVRDVVVDQAVPPLAAPRALNAKLAGSVVGMASSEDGLFVLRRNKLRIAIDVYDPTTLRPVSRIAWENLPAVTDQVVATPAGVYVVGGNRAGESSLARIEGRKVVVVSGRDPGIVRGVRAWNGR